MMKRIRPDYYDKFTCIASRCPISCCQEWKIAVDDETNRRWKKLLPPAATVPQKKNLGAYTIIKCKDRVIELTERQLCPFLDQDGLCSLVIEYGDQVLSDTCATFPREIHRYGAHEEEVLLPCCPAVIDLLWEEQSLDFLESAQRKLDETEMRSETEKALFLIRKNMIHRMQDSESSAEKLLLNEFYIVRELYSEMEKWTTGQNNTGSGKEKQWAEKIQQLTEAYFSEENVRELSEAIQNIESDALATMEERNELLQDLAVNYRREGLYQSVLEPLCGKAEELSVQYDIQQMEETVQRFENAYLQYEPFMKKFLMNEFLLNLILPGSDLESFMIQLQWISLKYSVIKHGIFLRWLMNGKQELAYEDVREIVVVICRMTGYEEEDIYEYLENSFEELIWDWGYLHLIIGSK